MKDIQQGKTRRGFLKGTAVAMTVPLILTSRKGETQTTQSPLPPSPPTIPWQEALPNATTPLQSALSIQPLLKSRISPLAKLDGRLTNALVHSTSRQKCMR